MVIEKENLDKLVGKYLKLHTKVWKKEPKKIPKTTEQLLEQIYTIFKKPS